MQNKKARNNELKQANSKLDGEIEIKRNDVDHLKAQIVRSPEKIKRQMVEIEEAFEKEKTLLANLERQLLKDENKSQVTAKIASDLNLCVTLLKESQAVTEATLNKKQEIKKLKLEHNQFEQQMRDLNAREEQLGRIIQSSEESKKRQEALLIPKIEKSREELTKALSVRQEVEASKLEAISVLNANETATKEILLKKEQTKVEFEQEISEMQEVYDLLMTDLVSYQQRLHALIGANKENLCLV